MKFHSKLGLCMVVWLFLNLLMSTEAGSQQIEDVIYLKNGSIIRGIIIEQVPGESVKIQTREGNLFVYQMAQIDKIMKESMVKRTGHKSPGLALGLSLGGGILIDGVGQWYNGDIGKGFGFAAWSLVGQLLIVAGNEDNETFGYDIDDDDSLILLGLMSRIASYTTAAIDAYRSAKRKNEEGGYPQLLRRDIQSYPRLDFGLGRLCLHCVSY